MSKRMRLMARSLACFVLFFTAGLCAVAAELASWQAGTPEQARGLTLVREKDADWKIEKQAGVWVAAVVPLNDYTGARHSCCTGQASRRTRLAQRRVPGPRLRVDLARSRRAGGIPSPLVAPVDEQGVARLNTGKFRHATFRLEAAALDRPLRISALRICAP